MTNCGDSLISSSITLMRKTSRSVTWPKTRWNSTLRSISVTKQPFWTRDSTLSWQMAKSIADYTLTNSSRSFTSLYLRNRPLSKRVSCSRCWTSMMIIICTRVTWLRLRRSLMNCPISVKSSKSCPSTTCTPTSRAEGKSETQRRSIFIDTRTF